MIGTCLAAIALGLTPPVITPDELSASRDSISRAIRYRIDVPAPLDRVWHAWTTVPGLREWFARDAVVELAALGRFEILFMPENPPGQRGAENNLILAVQPQRFLSFTWDAPPSNPEARRQRTSVALRFQSLGPTQTRVWFEQTGWGEGGSWDVAFDYFTEVWAGVLAQLRYRFTNGPLDWDRPPTSEQLTRFTVLVERW
ncbi:MAG: SRPBCC family protein [Gemmatimonadales bacterium]